MVAGPEVLVVMLPVLSEPALEFVKVVPPVQRKQYKVLVDKLVLGNVTVWLETEEAVLIPGHAVAPDGRFVVATVQLLAVPLTVKPVGNVT